jgi:hypothetical protein
VSSARARSTGSSGSRRRSCRSRADGALRGRGRRVRPVRLRPGGRAAAGRAQAADPLRGVPAEVLALGVGGAGPGRAVESLVRALLLCFEHAGGVPAPGGLRQSEDGGARPGGRRRPIWNQTLAQVAIDYGFTIELCAPRSPEQKGAVENLVGWVKRSFFRARRFADLEHDLPRQLLEWLVVVNEERPSRATKEIPKRRLAAERERMKPLAIIAGRVRLRYPVQVGPTALVEFGASATRCRPVRAASRPRCTSTRTACGSSRRRPLRGHASALPEGRHDQLPAGPARRAARGRGRCPQAPLLHA